MIEAFILPILEESFEICDFINPYTVTENEYHTPSK